MMSKYRWIAAIILLLALSALLALTKASARQHRVTAGTAQAPAQSVLLAPSAPVYGSGAFTFATPQELIRPPLMATPGVTLLDQDQEPEVKVDLSGNVYVTAIHGVPGGVDLWKSTDKGATFAYLGEPDGAQDKCNVAGTVPCTAGAGGGDDSIDISTGGYLYVSSLSASPRLR